MAERCSTGATEPAAWQRRAIGKDGQPWSAWYTIGVGRQPGDTDFDGFYNYEFRPLFPPQSVDAAQAAPMPWPSREIVAREIRRAMLDNPTAGTFNKREAEREKVADDAAEAIMARFEQSRAQPTQGGNKGEPVLAALKELRNIGDSTKHQHYKVLSQKIHNAVHKLSAALAAAPQPASNAYASEDVTPKMVSAGMAEIPEDGCEYEHVEAAYRAMRLVALSSTQNATPSGAGGPGPVVADQHAAANTPATSFTSRGSP